MKCKNCGCMDFVKFGDHYECICCGFSVPLDETEEFNQNIKQYNELESLNNVLIGCLNEPRFNESISKDTASNILKIDSSNVLANFVISFLDRHTYPENYKNFIGNLKSIDFVDNQEELIVPFMINNSEYKYFDSISDMLIEKGIYSKYSAVIYTAKKKLEEQDENYSDTARDIFICYSSNDIDVVKTLVEKIENDGNSCWYSDRNMPKNSMSQDDYKAKIENAISSTKVFLVIMSTNSMLSNDVKWELDMANKHQIDNRIEYRIQDVENTTKFRLFFDGIQWIDASNEPQEIVLLSRIYELLHQNNIDADIDNIEETTDLYTGKTDFDNDEFASNDEENNEFQNDDSNESDSDSIDENEEGTDDYSDETEGINDLSLNERVIALFEKEKYEEAFNILDSYDELPSDTENLVYYYIGYCFEKGYGTEPDFARSNYFYNLAKSNNPVGSDKNLGICFFLLGKSYFMDRYNNHVRNCSGIDRDMDTNEGYDLLKKAADYGNAEAMTYLGLCSKYGLYARESDDDAFNWFADAADNNSGLGAFHLGKCYEQGLGVIQNKDEAFKAYLKSATLGNDKGIVATGVCYYYGIGTSQSYDYAVKYYCEAVDLNNTTAMYNLAQCYFKGNGVPQDENTALELMKRAANSGYKPAKEFLNS